MQKRMTHFSTLKDARDSFSEVFGRTNLDFDRKREGFSIWRLRDADSGTVRGKLYDGPDCLLFISR